MRENIKTRICFISQITYSLWVNKTQTNIPRRRKIYTGIKAESSLFKLAEKIVEEIYETYREEKPKIFYHKNQILIVYKTTYTNIARDDIEERGSIKLKVLT